MLAPGHWPALVLLARTPELLDRLRRKLRGFVSILRYDSTGVAERSHWIPTLLLTWFVANLVATPLSYALARLLGIRCELRKLLGVNAWLGFVQVAFFALHWYVVDWGQRSLDWAVFSVSLIPSTLVAKWAFEATLLRTLAYTVVQAFLALLVVFVVAFVGAETGRWTF